MFDGRKTKKIIAVCLTVLLAGLFLVHPVKAIVGIPVTAVPPGLPIIDVTRQINQSFGAALASGLVSGASYFLNKLAYDMSTWIVSGDYDNRPLFLTKDAGKYFAEQGLNAVGDVLGYISDNTEFLKKYKVNLCTPPDIRLQLWLKLAVVDVFEPKPRCSWESITTAYQRMAEPGYWQNVGVGFTAGQNDLSVLNQIYGFTKEESLRKELEAEKNKQYQGRATCQMDAVTGECKTPVPIIEKEMEAQAPSSFYEREVAPELGAFIVTLGNGNLGAIFANAGKLFLNNLAAKSMQKLLQLGFISILGTGQESLENLQLGSLQESYASGGGTRASAERAFADFLTPQLVAVDSYNYVAEMADCSDEKNRGYLTCAIDDGLQAALAQAEAGAPLTVKEAMDKNFLHPDWVLYGPDFTDKNSSFKCALEGYCYSNLVKLRLWRILPVGFELAAKQSTPENRVTLRNALAHFNDFDNSSGLQHLIDPDWVIKAPTARCDALTYGSIYLTGQNQRAQYCADPQSCVQESEDGQCANDTSDSSWGYCLREKNIWRLGGDSCDAQYNTCAAYTNSKGGKVAYLANTLDKGLCSAQNAGCRAYSQSRNLDLAGWSSNKDVFLNNKAEQCAQTSEGCSKFIKIDGSEVNLKKAPGGPNALPGYNCYGEKNGQSGWGEALSGGLGSWPVNKADLYKIFATWGEKQKTECGRFAGVCAAEEVGCERYTPQNGNPPIPGILSANDVCPSECAGYETYIEQPTLFAPQTATTYFIASSAQSCNSQYAGCDEFINLETQAGETKSYFSELRACSKTESEGDTFYTWEGSDTAGYQLKAYTLKKAGGFYGSILFTDSSGATKYLDDSEWTEQSLSPPAYNVPDTSAKIAEYAQKCNRDIYGRRSDPGVNFDSDCREFYDKDGKKSYRLYSKTVTINPTDCQKFRKSVSDQASCAASGGNWDSQGFCVYFAIPQEGKMCPATANGCRAYKGNAGNNFQTIYSESYDRFKPGQSDGDSNQYSAESLSVGGVSLKVNSGVLISPPMELEKGDTYVVSFWAKGNPGNITVAVLPADATGNPVTITGVTPPQQTVAVNSDWSSYTVGPFEISWDKNQAPSSVFRVANSAGVFFVDNVLLKKMTANVYVIKNSWNTPTSCDNVLGDPVGASAGGAAGNSLRLVPQAQLGCANYQTSKFETVTAKSFTQMCREEAVGCEKLTDTFNNAATSTYYYNVQCRLAGSIYKNISNQPMPCKDKQGVERCQIAPNQSVCLFNTVYDKAPGAGTVLDDISGGVTTDTEGNGYTTLIQTGGGGGAFSIPADRGVYLVNDQKYQCAAENLGCQALGLVDYDKFGSATSTQTAHLKNNPDKYNDILCSQEAEGCEGYTTSQGGLAYFRDPAVWGNKLCEWQANKHAVDGLTDKGTQTGWFIKGSEQVCYSDLGIRTVGSPGYDSADGRKVGICPVEQDTCSEFIDPLATSPSHPAGQPYFVLNNQKLDRASCQGQASLKKGCVLFNETAKGAKLWNTTSTYIASQVKNYELVAPVDCGRRGEKGAADGCKDDTNLDVNNFDEADANNANVVFKVQRDRACGEWLACKSSYSVWDDKLGQYKKVCTEIGRCNQLPLSGSSEACGNWIDGTHEYTAKILENTANPSEPNVLKRVTNYQARRIDWGGMDFAGFSRPDWYPLEELSMIDASSQQNEPEWHLGKKITLNDINKLANNFTQAQCSAAGGGWVTIPFVGSGCFFSSYNDTACTAVGGYWLTGKGLCVQTPKGNLTPADAPGITCRGYPEAGAPLPNTQSLFDTQPINVSNTNLCAEDIGEWKNLKSPFMIPERPNGIALTAEKANACDCNYTKAEYEGKTLFWQYDNPNANGSIVDKRAKKIEEAPRGVLPGVCINGPYIGMACSSAADCSKPKTEEGAQGTCAPLNKASRVLGLQGLCVEEDTSQALYGEKGKHPCLAWLPVDQTPGMYDIFNQHKEAGFDPQSSQLGFIDGPYYCTEAKRWEKRPGYQIDNVQGYFDCDGGQFTDGASDGTNADGVFAPPLNVPEKPLAPYFYYYDKVTDSVNIEVFRGCQGIGATNCDTTKTKIVTPPQKICSEKYTAFNLRQFTRELVSCSKEKEKEEEDKFTMSFDCRPYQTSLAQPDSWGITTIFKNPAPDDSKQTGWTGWFYDPNGKINEDYIVPALSDTPMYSEEATNRGWDDKNWANAGQHFPAQNEDQEWRCSEMYKVAQNGNNKANTQLLWQESKEPFIGNKNCDPVGALAIYSEPPLEGAAIIDTLVADRPCLKGKITDDPDLPEDDGAFYQGGILMQLEGNADNSIKRYFTQGFERWFARDDKSQYYPAEQTAQYAVNLGYIKQDNAWDTSESYGKTWGAAAPKMAAVGACSKADSCREVAQNFMTVNGLSSGAVEAGSGFGNAQLRFFAWADDSHMPLRSVVVDWGDGERAGEGVVGYYRNHRGLDPTSSEPICEPKEEAGAFGYILGKSCDTSYFNFSHAYSCLGASSVGGNGVCDSNGNPTSGKTSCWIAPNATYSKGACVFKPRVHLQDNWGWCNGTCGDTDTPGRTGCYDASVENQGECVLSNPGPWTAFDGKVVVTPK